MAKSAVLGLELTGTGSDDTSQSFLAWRQKINGTSSDSNMNLIDAAVGELQTQISDLSYVPIEINTFTANPATAEKGSTVTSVTLTYAMNKVPTTLKLGSETLTPAKNGTKSLTGQSLTSNTTWSLEAKDSGSATISPKTVTKNVTLSFLSKAYWGAAAIPETVNSTFILGLSNGELTSTKARTITVNATSGKYIWYAVPTSFGTCSFKVGGFDGGFEAAQTISHTNASGHTENYYVYRSTNPSLGSTTVVVS